MPHATTLALEPSFITAFNAALAHAKSEALAYILSILRAESPADHPAHRERRLAAAAILRQTFLRAPAVREPTGDHLPLPLGEGRGEGLGQPNTTHAAPSPHGRGWGERPSRRNAARDCCQTPTERSSGAGLVADAPTPLRAASASDAHGALADEPPVAPGPTHPKPQTPDPKPDSSPPEPARIELGLAFPHRAPTAASRLFAAAGSTRSFDSS